LLRRFRGKQGDVSFLMVVASILDPRFKISLIRFCFKKLYPSDEIENQIEEVKSKVKMIFEKYKNDYVAFSNLSGSSNSVGVDTTLDNIHPENDYFSFVIENQTEESPKSILEVYLEEKVLVVGKGETFDVLE
jgi:Domain of unknown function (DUF4413)